MISVVVCTYKRVGFLVNCLNALANQDFPKDGYEIVLINNNSPDNTEQVCQDFIISNPSLHIQYCLETQQGLSYARNRGIVLSKGEIIAFLDDDAIARPDYLQKMNIFFEDNPQAVACGGRIYPLFESKRPKWMSKYLLALTSSIDMGDKVKRFSHKKYPIGANMVFRKFVFEKFGMFDVNLGRRGDNLEGAEEKAIFYKLYQNNLPAYYVPDAIVDHAVPDKRLTYDFFKRQAYGVGYSERIRAKSISQKEYTKSVCKEFAKWGGSFVLFVYYTLTLRPKAGFRLLEYRWFISKKLFGNGKISLNILL